MTDACDSEITWKARSTGGTWGAVDGQGDTVGQTGACNPFVGCSYLAWEEISSGDSLKYGNGPSVGGNCYKGAAEGDWRHLWGVGNVPYSSPYARTDNCFVEDGDECGCLVENFDIWAWECT